MGYKILFIQHSPSIRNYKMARALRAKGHAVTAAYNRKSLEERHPGLSDRYAYDNWIYFHSNPELWALMDAHDIAISFNEPDTHTLMALPGGCPVIHDCADLLSLRSGHWEPVMWERAANQRAVACIYSTEYQQRYCQERYDLKDKPTAVFGNFCMASDLDVPLETRLQNGETRLVYQGLVTNKNTHRNFFDLFGKLSELGLHVHIYPTFWTVQDASIFGRHERIHYHHPVSPHELVSKISQYDLGLIPWNLELGNRAFLDTCIANKYWDYLAAGLPVAAADTKPYREIFSTKLTGFTFKTAEDLAAKIKKQLPGFKGKSDFLRSHAVTCESEIYKVEDLIQKVLCK